MIRITPQMRILVAVEPTDFRRGIDGLARVCKEVLRHDPFSGGVFVFRNRSGTALKILVYDGQGFWLCQKRLSRGHFSWWPVSNTASAKTLAAISCRFCSRPGIPRPRRRRRRGARSDRPSDALRAPSGQRC
jgi:transposase